MEKKGTPLEKGNTLFGKKLKCTLHTFHAEKIFLGENSLERIKGSLEELPSKKERKGLDLLCYRTLRCREGEEGGEREEGGWDRGGEAESVDQCIVKERPSPIGSRALERKVPLQSENRITRDPKDRK